MNFDNIKFASRVLHMLSVVSLSGSVTYNYISGNEVYEKIKNHRNYALFHNTVAVIMFASGLANWVFVRGGKELTDPVHKMWTHFLEFKFVLAMLLTPLIYPLTTLFVEEGEKQISD